MMTGKNNKIDPNGSDKMRPELKRMNERLGYFLHQMDLDNAHIKHAEERIEELEKENKQLLERIKICHDTLEINNINIERIENYNTTLEEKLQKLEKDMIDSYMRKLNDELTKDNARIMTALIQIREEKNIAEESVSKCKNEIISLTKRLDEKEDTLYKTKADYEELLAKYEMATRIEGHHYCNCGAIAYIHYQIDGGKYYCGQCFKRDVIKL